MPKLLDLCCGAGGASAGYVLAGWDVYGVDIQAQPRSPFRGEIRNALDYLADPTYPFDAIHASPPAVSLTARRIGAHAVPYTREFYDKLRAALLATGKPFVMENWHGAERGTYQFGLCGHSLGWPFCWHRRFESNVCVYGTIHADEATSLEALNVSPTLGPLRSIPLDRSNLRPIGERVSARNVRRYLGIDWMSWGELGQALPPCYTCWIGRQLLSYV